MRMKTFIVNGRLMLSFVLAVSAVLSMEGCSSSSSDLGVYLAGDIQGSYGYCPTIEVDVVGLTDAEEKRFIAYDVDRYFAPQSKFRENIGAVTLKFSEDDMTAKMIPDDATCWDRWKAKGAKYIAVISNLPLIVDPKDSAVDPRKLIINMNDGFLIDSSVHYVEVGGSGIIELKRPPETKKQDIIK